MTTIPKSLKSSIPSKVITEEQDRTRPNEYDVFWINHFNDYIVNHEMVIDESKIHSGGACSSNVIARNAIREGEIDKNFLCPHKGNGEKCLMRLLVEEKRNCSLHLYLKFEVEK